MKKLLPENIEAAWVQLMRASQHVRDGAEQALKQAGFVGLDWYDVLLELKRAGAAGLRPFELEDRLLLKQYNLSRLLARMVKAGLAEKQRCQQDGRGFRFCITTTGVQMQEAMWPVYAGALRQGLARRLTSDEAGSLVNILRKVTLVARSGNRPVQ